MNDVSVGDKFVFLGENVSIEGKIIDSILMNEISLLEGKLIGLNLFDNLDGHYRVMAVDINNPRMLVLDPVNIDY